MSQLIEDRIQQGRDAYGRHAWHEAFDSLREADSETPLAPDDLGLLAESAWFAGDPDAAREARQRAHAEYLEQGDKCHAAEMALQLALDHFDRLETAIGNGWLGRARRLLERTPEECAAHGWQAASLAYIALRMIGDSEEAFRQATLAQGIGERLAIPAVQAMALQGQGYALVAMGRVEEGLALIDESTVAAISGDLDPLTTGKIYCSTISVCRDLADWRRAVEWTDAAERWCRRQGVSGFPGICRVHRAEIMHFRGSWADAEREAKRACEELGKYDVLLSGEAQYEIGEVRLRVGDMDGAREAFHQAHELSREPEPGRSLLRLAAGDAHGANISVKRALAAVESRAFRRARLLPAAAEIALSAGDLDSAAQHVAELEQIADSFRTTAVIATAEYARGLLLSAQGDTAAAQARQRHAMELWQEIGAPYETAKARTALGEAYRAAGDEDAARLEFESAKAAFERLGALPDAKRVGQLLGDEQGIAARAGERVTRTFVFTDIVSSTPLVEVLGDDAWQELIRWHDQTLRMIFNRYGGTEVRQTGDGFFVAFEDASAAIEGAVAVQRSLAEHRRGHGFAPQVRIGLHEAEASTRAIDFAGRGVHEAARIGSLANGGQILASVNTVKTAATRFPISAPRTVALKGVSQPVEVVTIEWM
ncbi:MAG TPA: adenylate/guanylate cyclase domain-containing protein [Propionibacteriaceae bacterium]|nr:adenylate/guanylate cyclase domain-containing protein [Propionibacteriaceae bacterium]